MKPDGKDNLNNTQKSGVNSDMDKAGDINHDNDKSSEKSDSGEELTTNTQDLPHDSPQESASKSDKDGQKTPPLTPEEEEAKKIADIVKEGEENKDKYLRTYAEYQNYIKRSRKEMDAVRKFAIESFASDLLPVSDSLKNSLTLLQNNKESLPEKLLEGYEMTLKVFNKVLEKIEIKEVNPLGEPFNPEFHQVVEMVDNNDEYDKYKPETVCEVLQVGFTIHGRLLRSAMVKVKK